MPITQFDQSSYEGAPIRLYEFSRGVQVWRYTNADADIVRGTIAGLDKVWTAISCFDSGIVAASENPDSDDLTVTVPWSLELVQLYAGTPPASSVYLRIYDTDDGDANEDTDLAWIGTISAVRKADEGVAEIVCNTLTRGFDRPGLRLGWQRTCPYALYDDDTCKVSKSSFAVSGTASDLTGTTVTVSGLSAKPDGWFNGGFIEWVVYAGTPNVYERRPGHTHVGDVLTLLSTTDGIADGTTITAYPGCDRLTQTCNDKFSNLANCGAIPWMPGISPFDGRMVF